VRARTAHFSRQFSNVSACNLCAVSSSRRGPQALLELTTWAERGYDLAITPDGPRGPLYVVQDGAMALAQVKQSADCARVVSNCNGKFN